MANQYRDEDQQLFGKHCKGYKYMPLIYPAQKRIIVMGDLHGDMVLTIKMLKLANLINDQNKWIGDDTYVVQVGDQLDNCRPNGYDCFNPLSSDESSLHGNMPQDIAVLNFMTELNREAIKYGGAVISLIGNHELMNIAGNFSYVSRDDIDKFKKYMGSNGS